MKPAQSIPPRENTRRPLVSHLDAQEYKAALYDPR